MMCKVCDNIWEDYCSCKGITYNEEYDTFYSQCGDAYYDFPVNYCYECGRKLDKTLVKEGGNPEREVKQDDVLDSVVKEWFKNWMDRPEPNLTGPGEPPMSAKEFFTGSSIEAEEMLKNLKFGKEMKVTITKEKNERRRME